MIYKVKECAPDTTTTGKPIKRLVVENTEGESVKVNIFSDFPHYADIIVGYTIDGEIRKNDKGYNNLYSNEIKRSGGAGGAYKQQVIEESMQRKETSIGKFQDNKEFSIMVASSMSNAVNLAIAEGKDDPLYDLALGISKWRQYILDNWSVDPKDIKPF